MTFSDAIYGPCERYVSRQRLSAMLDHEFGLLIERLDAKRGDTTRFFVFADTVAAKSFKRHDDATAGWACAFRRPASPASQIIMHVRMLDKETSSSRKRSASSA